MQVNIQLDDAEALAHLSQALAQFEDFCIVTQSVCQGIPMTIEVMDQNGKRLN